MKMGRHYLLSIVAVLILLIGIVAPAGAQTQTKGPIKIGLIYPVTGVFAVQGITQFNSAKMFFEQMGMKVAGRPIKLISEDSEGKPDVALMKTKKVVEFDKVDVICGYHSTAEGYAVRDYVHEKKIPTISTSSGMKHTRDQFSPYFFRVPPGSQQCNYEISKWWAQNGYKGKTFKNIIWAGADYAAPREHFQGYKKGLEEVGGKVVQELWAPLGATDLGPYLSAVKVGEADALIGGMFSEMATRLANQWVEYGLNKRIPLIGVSSFCDEGATLLGMGINANGILSCQVTCANTDIPENKKFVEEYKKRYKMLPAFFSYLTYIAVRSAYEGMATVKGNVEDKEKFLDAIRKVNFISPMGYRAYFDEKQGMVHDFIFLEARKTNGECHNFEIGRIKNVKDPYHVFP